MNSEWSREAIIADGADPSKIEILPLAFAANADKLKAETRYSDGGNRKKENENEFQLSPAAETAPPVSQTAFSISSCNYIRRLSQDVRPLKVLWLGQVNVGKGVHHLMEAARLVARERIHFDVVGPIGILPQAVASVPGNMTFHGPVSRDRAARWYRQSDVFVLPTLSDGFALTQLEALAHGLPVIVTPNCGRVVQEGKTGFIIPPRDPQALADAILRFMHNPGLSQEMAPFCRQAVNAYSVDAYGKRLVEIIQKHFGRRSLNPAL